MKGMEKDSKDLCFMKNWSVVVQYELQYFYAKREG